MTNTVTYESWNVTPAASIGVDWSRYFQALEGSDTQRVRRGAGAEPSEPSPAVSADTETEAAPEVRAYDDIFDVEMELYPADAKVSEGPRVLYGLINVSESHPVAVNADGSSEVTFTVSSICGRSVLEHADAHLTGVDNETRLSFSDLHDRGMIDVSEGGPTAQMTLRGLASGSYKFNCDNGIAAEIVGQTSATHALAPAVQIRVPQWATDLNGIYSDHPSGPDRFPAEGTRFLIDDGTGRFVDCTEGQNVVQGNYGILVGVPGSLGHNIAMYAPIKNPANIGKVDVFTYKLSHPTAGESTAKIYVRIGSEQVDLEWDDANPTAEARSVEAADDHSFVSIGQLVSGSSADGAAPGTVSGNVTENDRAASKFTVLAVSLDGENYEAVAVDGTELTGKHGALTIRSDGSYTYVSRGDQESVGQSDEFGYRLYHPNGKIAEATLSIDIMGPHEDEAVTLEDHTVADPLDYLSPSAIEELQNSSESLLV